MQKHRMHKDEILFYLAVQAVMFLTIAFFGYGIVKLVNEIFVI